MPIYEYLCENGHRFDRLQKFSEEPVQDCEVCATPVRRVLHPVAVHFKGSGFYTTDYGRGKAAKADGSKDGGGPSSSDGGSSSKNGGSSSDGGAKKSEAKASD